MPAPRLPFPRGRAQVTGTGVAVRRPTARLIARLLLAAGDDADWAALDRAQVRAHFLNPMVLDREDGTKWHLDIGPACRCGRDCLP